MYQLSHYKIIEKNNSDNPPKSIYFLRCPSSESFMPQFAFELFAELFVFIVIIAYALDFTT